MSPAREGAPARLVEPAGGGRAGDLVPPHRPPGAQAGEITFGPFRLAPARQLLLKGDEPVPLGSRALEILMALAERPGEVVSRDELVARAWPGITVDESNLRTQIAALRRALGDDGKTARYVATVPGRGHCFVGALSTEVLEPPPASPRHRAVLPDRITRPIGRDALIDVIIGRLERRRFVTLVGAGGIGKTTLALAVADRLGAAFRDGVRVVDLAPLADASLVANTFASALGADTRTPDDPAAGVLAYLRESEVLIVLDNCEHLADAAAFLSEELLRAAPGVRLLATSREPLRAEGESVLRVPPLETPPATAGVDAAAALSFGAVRLFVDRASASAEDFELTDADVPVVTEICQRLDGLPLAIELAAARVDAFGVRELRTLLDGRLLLLTQGRRTALPRHRTLAATLGWSYDLLPEAERRLFRALGIFASGFTVEAAAAVMGDLGTTWSGVAEGVANLVAKSLVAPDASGDRWRLLETTRAYALDKLAECGEVADVARRHARFFRDLLAPAAAISEVHLDTDNEAQHAREIDNVRAAIDWAFSPDGEPLTGIMLTAAYVPVWQRLTSLVECRERVERALDRLGREVDVSAPLRMSLQIAFGLALLHWAGSTERTEATLAEALEVAEGLGDVQAQLRALWAIWTHHFNNGDNLAAQRVAERFSTVARGTGDPADLLIGDRLTGNTLHYAGRQPEARACFERVIELYAPPDDQRHARWFVYDQRLLARARLARVLWLQGFPDRARDTGQQSLDEAEAAGHKLSVCFVLGNAVCPVALMTGDLALAATSLARLNGLVAAERDTFWKSWAACLDGNAADQARRARDRLGPAPRRARVRSARSAPCGARRTSSAPWRKAWPASGRSMRRSARWRRPWSSPPATAGSGATRSFSASKASCCRGQPRRPLPETASSRRSSWPDGRVP